MRQILLTAALAFTACAPSRGTTPCGLELTGEEWLDISTLSEAERVILAHVGPLADSADACAMLRGYTVAARGPGRWWQDTQEGRVEVDGNTNCVWQRIDIAEWPGDPWQFTALAHEVTHVLTRCNGHTGWTERGITQALTDVYFTGVPDER